MDVTCDTCGASQYLGDAAADRDNWEAVSENQPVVDDELGTVMRAVAVAHRLVWVCDADPAAPHVNEVVEPIDG